MSKKQDNYTIPLTTSELVLWLKKLFPINNPSPDDDIKTIMFKAGQQDVINFIESKEKENQSTTEVFK